MTKRDRVSIKTIEQHILERRGMGEAALTDAGVHVSWEPMIVSDSVDPHHPEEGVMQHVGWRIYVLHCGQQTAREFQLRDPRPYSRGMQLEPY